jgi:thioredoxin reductase (NADPH)
VTSSPTLLFYRSGERTGEVLTGGVRRLDLMRNLDALLPEGRAQAIRARVRPVETDCDVLILGGGPAGLTAAIYAAQARLDTVVVDTRLPGGQVGTTHQVSNYPGFVEAVPGYRLAHAMSEQARAAGVSFRPAADVDQVDLERREVRVDGWERVRGRRLVIATGSRPRPLGIPGEEEYRGRGISCCSTCDAKYYQDREVVVIGGGNTAVEESLFIARFARRLTVVHQFARLQANRLAQEKALANEKIRFLFEHEPRAFRRRGTAGMEVEVEELKTGARRTLETDGVFVFAGMMPNLEPFGPGLARDRWGYLVTDAEMRTSVPGVYAVGDVRSKAYRQITISAAEGTIAAMAAARELEGVGA